MPKKKTKKKVDEKDVQIQELKNQFVRALADYDNLQKRVEREQGEYAKVANIELIKRLLPIHDMLIQAQGHLSDPGLAMTIGQFESILKEEGVEQIKIKKGDKFDEHLHEAVEFEGGKKPAIGSEGKVVKVLLTGWQTKSGKVIRYAKVNVS